MGIGRSTEAVSPCIIRTGLDVYALSENPHSQGGISIETKAKINIGTRWGTDFEALLKRVCTHRARDWTTAVSTPTKRFDVLSVLRLKHGDNNCVYVVQFTHNVPNKRTFHSVLVVPAVQGDIDMAAITGVLLRSVNVIRSIQPLNTEKVMDATHRREEEWINLIKGSKTEENREGESCALDAVEFRSTTLRHMMQCGLWNPRSIFVSDNVSELLQTQKQWETRDVDMAIITITKGGEYRSIEAPTIWHDKYPVVVDVMKHTEERMQLLWILHNAPLGALQEFRNRTKLDTIAGDDSESIKSFIQLMRSHSVWRAVFNRILKREFRPVWDKTEDFEKAVDHVAGAFNIVGTQLYEKIKKEIRTPPQFKVR